MVLKRISKTPISFEACKTDRAYAKFWRLVGWLQRHAALIEIIQAVKNLEGRLQLLEGGGRGDEFRAFDGGDVPDEYLEWLDIRASLDELAVAFLVTLQTRLVALKQACCKVGECAADENMTVSMPPHDPPSALWSLANYCKHRDEWPESAPLEGMQVQTFRGLKKAVPGLVGGDAQGERTFEDLLPMKACLAIGNEPTLGLAMPRIIDKAAKHYEGIAGQIDQAFVGHEARLAELREEQRGLVERAIRDGVI